MANTHKARMFVHFVDSVIAVFFFLLLLLLVGYELVFKMIPFINKTAIESASSMALLSPEQQSALLNLQVIFGGLLYLTVVAYLVPLLMKSVRGKMRKLDDRVCRFFAIAE